ncbi:MAG: tetratricopeptide repeat protein [Planctomycetota bacterium]
MLPALALFLLAQAGPPTADQAERDAQEALAAGRRLEALEHYEACIRAVEDTARKARYRKAYLAAGWAEPRPLTLAEERVILGHIRAERVRLYERAAGDFESAKKRQAAILMRRVIADLYPPKAARAKQAHERIKKLVRALTERPTEDEKREVEELLKKKKEAKTLLKAGRKLLSAGRYRVVVHLCQQMMFGKFDKAAQDAAIALRKEAETRAADDVTVADREAVRKIMDDTRFDRLAVARSRHFMFVGPETFIEALPEKQLLLLDLAYIFQSDLAVQPLTANGVRLVVYYQETFDFGGGLAGGKLIRIGRPAIRLPVAGMLHYHELGHCIFGKGWLHQGFTEGLADFAAGFTLDALGQTPEARMFIVEARTQFVRFFLGRDVRYFHIQPYKPAAGFLFSFLPPGDAPYDWTPYRRAFNRMREWQFGSWPTREHQIMRYFGFLMAAEYGPSMYDTLREWGWPVDRRDFGRVPGEANELLSAVKQGDFRRGRGEWPEAREHYEAVLAAEPDGPLAPRALYGLLLVANKRGDRARLIELKRRLGILEAFKVLGAFQASKQARYAVLPPESGPLDFGKPVRYRHETAQWKNAKVRADGYVDLKKQGWGYFKNACAFAVAYLHSDSRLAARVWIGSDDGHAVWVNGRLGEKRPLTRRFTFDDDFCDVELVPGWNRVLIKVHNGAGEWGFLARITDRAGRPLDLRTSTDEHEKKPRTVKRSWTPIVTDEFRSFVKRRWRQAVGKFDTQNGRLRAHGTAKLGLWQRFVVDPDKPSGGPANIAWLREPELAGADDLKVEVAVAAQAAQGLPAKFGITVDGENENDGQSGHTFVFEAAATRDKKKMMKCSWYRYDRMLYLNEGEQVEPADVYRVEIVRIGTTWTVKVNDAVLFSAVDAKRLPAAGIGLLTWGKTPQFEALRVHRAVSK